MTSQEKKGRKKLISPPWWTDECAAAVKERKTAEKVYNKSMSTENLDNYIKIAANCKRLLRKTKRKWSICGDKMAAKTALVILAEGAEEMEAVITTDVLRRAGVDVTVGGLDGAEPVLCSRKITIVPDKSLEQAIADHSQYDAVILPGGLEGSDRLSKSAKVGALLQEQEKAGRVVAAICAAPTAFVAHGVGRGRSVTSYPSTKDKVEGPDYKYVEGQQVVVDGNVVTSRGPGTAFQFGLKLAEILVGKEKAAQVEKGMILAGY